MQFIENFLALLVYGAALFAIVQYFDFHYQSTLERGRETADKQYTGPHRGISEETGEIGELWARIQRWGHDVKRHDVFVLAILMITFPLIILIYIIISTIEWSKILVSSDSFGVIVGNSFLIFYSLSLFAVSCFSFRRILLQRASLNQFEKELEILAVRLSIAPSTNR